MVKVERPDGGDDTRAWGPPFVDEGSTYYLGLNRNKRSVTLDLKDAADVALARELCARADVVVESFRPGTSDRLGLGYDEVARTNPGVVYCSISAFGSGERAAALPGYDLLLQAMSGLMSVTGEPDGRPLKVGAALIDMICGLFATNGILAALRPASATAMASTSRSRSWTRRSPACSTRPPRTSTPASSRAAWATATRRSPPTRRSLPPTATSRSPSATTRSSPGCARSWAAPSWPATSASPPTRRAWSTETSWRRSSRRPSRALRPPTGWCGSARRACRPGRSTMSRRPSRSRPGSAWSPSTRRTACAPCARRCASARRRRL